MRKEVFHLSLRPDLEKIGVKAIGGKFYATSHMPCDGMWEACANVWGWGGRSKTTAKVRRVCLYLVSLKEGDEVEEIEGMATPSIVVRPGLNRHGTVRRCRARLVETRIVRPSEAILNEIARQPFRAALYRAIMASRET